jgi:hypothetical protein
MNHPLWILPAVWLPALARPQAQTTEAILAQLGHIASRCLRDCTGEAPRRTPPQDFRPGAAIREANFIFDGKQ